MGDEEGESFYDAAGGPAHAVGQPGGSSPGSHRVSEPRRPAPAVGTRLYHYSGGAGAGKWALVEKSTKWRFTQAVKSAGADNDDEDEDEDEADDEGQRPRGAALGRSKGAGPPRDWYLVVSTVVKGLVSTQLGIKFNDDALRVDFVHHGVWALRFGRGADYRSFATQYADSLFENTHHLEATAENREKVVGRDYVAWANGEDGDEAMWDADDAFDGPPDPSVREMYRQAAGGKAPQSLTMGALANSYLLHEMGVDVYKNMAEGVHGEGLSIRLQEPGGRAAPSPSYVTPKKAMLMRGETSMMLFSPSKAGKGSPQATGVQQLDIGSERVVANWQFEKDGTPIAMRDLTNDSKGAQLDHTESTFLGLDDNRLCRWDMRVKHGVVQDMASPALEWADGHQFSRGTNFQCFASTGDGCVAVGSRDGKVRLYSTTTMRQAKTSFPGLGSPITHIDATYDGKWVLATTDTYAMLISTLFRDKDGREKSGFSARMGQNIAAPRLLKLTPVHRHAAGNERMQNGQFSWVTEEGRQERNIVVTVGSYSVIWSFRRVKQTEHECYRTSTGLKTCYCYKIVPKDESIIDSRFMHDNYASSRSPEAPLVVATPHQVSSFNV